MLFRSEGKVWRGKGEGRSSGSISECSASNSVNDDGGDLLRSISFPTDLLSVLSQSLHHALSCALCLSLHLFHCLPMRGSRPHSA